MTRPILIFCCLWLACPIGVCLGHDSPEHVIEDLTRYMQRHGQSAQQLYRRACEYRILGRLEQAADDLHQAIALDAAYLPAYLELGRVQLTDGRPKAALETSRQADPLAASDAGRGRIHMLRCEIFLAADQIQNALRECGAACRLVPSEIEWSLQHSRLLGELGRHDARLAALESAIEANASVVLTIEQVEAQLDAGRGQLALPKIEQELRSSRWQSSWLIRRARVLRQQGRDDAARADLLAAVAEIDQRLHPERPDVALLIDRARAYLLLGQTAAATADLDAAQALHADPWSLRKLRMLVASAAAR